MCKKRCFTVLFNKQHANLSQTLFKFERRDNYQIYWSRLRQLSLKKSLMVILKILTLFVNTFTADDKYSLLNRDNLTQPFQMQLSPKTRSFFSTFIYISEICVKFWIFSKKRWPSWLMYFRNYGLQKTWLDIAIKSPVSAYPFTSNMVNRPKHCWNLNNSTVTIFGDHFEEKWDGKCLF